MENFIITFTNNKNNKFNIIYINNIKFPSFIFDFII